MKKLACGIGVLAVVLCGIFFLSRRVAHQEALQPALPSGSEAPASNRESSSANPETTSASSAVPQPESGLSNSNANQIKALSGLNPLGNQAEGYLQSLNQPIKFAGKVIDQDGNPVAEASVRLSWSQINRQASFSTNLLSDQDGMFNLGGVVGFSLNVNVSKEGYLGGRESSGTFRYGKEAPFQPAPADEGITSTFRLYKKGAGTALITSQHGVTPYLGVTVPFDGTPVYVDLLTGKPGPAGQIELSQVKPDPDRWKEAKEWSFRMTIRDGGFIEQHSEFPFEAPGTGYQPTVEFHFKKGETNWATGITKHYFIAFGNPRLYGCLNLETYVEMAGARLEYTINPDGSRYLEPK